MAFPPFLKRRAADAAETKPAAAVAADELQARTRARRRLIGAAVLLVIGIIAFPLLFETQPRPVPVDIPMVIPAREGAPPLNPPARTPRVASGTIAEPAASAPTPAAGPAVAVVPSPDTGSPMPAGVAPAASAARGAQAAASAPGASAPPASAPRRLPTEATPRGSDTQTATAAKAPAPQPATEPKVAPPRPVAEPKAAATTAAEAKTAATKAAAAPARPPAAAKAAAETRAATETKAAAKPATKPAAEVKGRFVVQVGAYADEASAKAARQRVERLGLKTYTQEVEVQGARRIRVRVGPFESQLEANKALETLKAGKLPGAVLSL